MLFSITIIIVATIFFVISITPVLYKISILSIHIIRTSLFQTKKRGTKITPGLIPSPASGIFPISPGFSLGAGNVPAQARGESSAREAARDIQLDRSSVFIYKISLFPAMMPALDNVFTKNKVSCSMCTTSPGTSTQFIVQIAQFLLQVPSAGSPALLNGRSGNTLVTDRSSANFAAGLLKMATKTITFNCLGWALPTYFSINTLSLDFLSLQFQNHIP